MNKLTAAIQDRLRVTVGYDMGTRDLAAKWTWEVTDDGHTVENGVGCADSREEASAHAWQIYDWYVVALEERAERLRRFHLDPYERAEEDRDNAEADADPIEYKPGDVA